MIHPTALLILFDGVEELEAVAPLDVLRRAGVKVTVASASAGLEITGRNGIHLRADTTLADCRRQKFDLVVLPGGPGHADQLENLVLLQLLRDHDELGKWIGSICAGPLVLDKAGVLEGRSFTSFPGTREKLPRRDPHQKVVCDRYLITSQGAGTALEFGLALVEALCGRAERDKVAESVCY